MYCFATIQNITDRWTDDRQMTQCVKDVTDSMVGQKWLVSTCNF